MLFWGPEKAIFRKPKKSHSFGDLKKRIFGDRKNCWRPEKALFLKPKKSDFRCNLEKRFCGIKKCFFWVPEKKIIREPKKSDFLAVWGPQKLLFLAT